MDLDEGNSGSSPFLRHPERRSRLDSHTSDASDASDQGHTSRHKSSPESVSKDVLIECCSPHRVKWLNRLIPCITT